MLNGGAAFGRDDVHLTFNICHLTLPFYRQVAHDPPLHVAHPLPPPSPFLPEFVPLIAKVENFLCTRALLHLGHFGLRRSASDRNNSSNALPHASHWNSYRGIAITFPRRPGMTVPYSIRRRAAAQCAAQWNR